MMITHWRNCVAILIFINAAEALTDEGRRFYFGNGTAMVNPTTVAISASFYAIVGLGLLSLWAQWNEAAAEAIDRQLYMFTPQENNGWVGLHYNKRFDIS